MGVFEPIFASWKALCKAPVHREKSPASGGGPVLGKARHRGWRPNCGQYVLPSWLLHGHGVQQKALGLRYVACSPGCFTACPRRHGLGAAPGGRRWGGEGSGAAWDGRDRLLPCWKSSSSSRLGVCADVAAAVAPGAAPTQQRVFLPCCEHGGVCVLVLSDPHLPLCYPFLSFLCKSGI